ncbi:MAG: type II toxin-antitoxin system VapC family toxin [Fimbriimonas sp.]|nr:type II toxin-antitoxin system VapC family toxin [Fimbriimonas sp.]
MANSLRLLLDTNVFIWSAVDPRRLTVPARKVIADADVFRQVSVVSVWEMQIKHAVGKLPLKESAERTAARFAKELHAGFLAPSVEHVALLDKLPRIHDDPFDRMLIAQAIVEGLTIVTADPVIAQYPVSVLW